MCGKYTAISKLKAKYQNIYAKLVVNEIYYKKNESVPPMTYELIKHIIHPWPEHLTTVLKVKNAETNRYIIFYLRYVCNLSLFDLQQINFEQLDLKKNYDLSTYDQNSPIDGFLVENKTMIQEEVKKISKLSKKSKAKVIAKEQIDDEVKSEQEMVSDDKYFSKECEESSDNSEQKEVYDYNKEQLMILSGKLV